MFASWKPSAVRGVLALLSVGAVIAVQPGAARPAEAAEPCWKTLLDDWYDGRLEASYPQACYRSAIRHLPADAVLYSNAKEEITAALRRRVLSGSATCGRAVQGRAHRAGPAKRALASTGPRSATSPPTALIAVAAAALLLIVYGLWQGTRSRRADH